MATNGSCASGGTFSSAGGDPTRPMREKTSNPIEYLGPSWARSGKDRVLPAVVSSFLHPVTALDTDASNCVYSLRFSRLE